MIYDHELRMYGTEGVAKRKRCGILGTYIEALDKCVYGGATYPSPSVSKKNTPSSQQQLPQPPKNPATQKVSQEIQRRKQVVS